MRDVRMRGFRGRTSVDDALAILAERTRPLEAEEAPVTEAWGRVAADDIRARVSVPHFDRAAMDGYALLAEGTLGASREAPVEIVVIGDSRPGHPYERDVVMGQCVCTTTGAPMPRGTDAIVKAEDADEVKLDGVRVARITVSSAPGRHVGRVGEDVFAGAIVVRRGRKLRAQDAGLLASVGVAQVPVIRRPTVRILITGDELLPPGAVPGGARIVDSNSVTLSALARRDGASAVHVTYVADHADVVRDALLAASEDVVLVSGGSSVGPEDHAPSVLAATGELTVHGLALRPASPAGFGFLRDRPVFLLPGNPVSAMCAYEFLAGSTIRAMGGLPRAWPHRRVTCTVAAKFASQIGRTDYTRVKVIGATCVPIMTSGASILSSTTEADGVVIVPADREGHDEGERVDVLLYD